MDPSDLSAEGREAHVEDYGKMSAGHVSTQGWFDVSFFTYIFCCVVGRMLCELCL